MHSRQPPGKLSKTKRLGTMHTTGLEEGTRVGDWRVLWRHEMGTFGVVYLAVRIGEEAAGPCALKLARSRAEARFGREAELLARVRHPNVPRPRGHGEWYGFPYVVMDWVGGVALYRWTQLCNPAWPQVARLLAKVAGALSAVHAAGGAHRDMKGDNVLVRLSDSEPMLMDFGAGSWEGAAPLTVGAPPGTPLYYSPERLRSHLNLLPPGAPSGAGPADDVYGLGVTAFRLLTDSYPFLEVEEAQRTQERLAGRPPRAPHELNPGVPPELSALVLRMMAARPEDRPSVHEVVRTLDALALSPEHTEEQLLFTWETEASQLGPGRRLRSRMEYESLLAQARIEEGQARVAAEVARVQTQQHAPSPPEPQPSPVPRRASAFRRLRALPWRRGARTTTPPPVPLEPTARPVPGHRAAARLSSLVVACLVFLIVALWPEPPPPVERREEGVQQAQDDRHPDAGTTGLGDAPLSAPASVASPEPARAAIALDMPKKPLPNQLLPPCKKPAIEINGGCWGGPIEGTTPPCGNQAYVWKNRCYWAFMGPPQQPATSDPP